MELEDGTQLQAKVVVGADGAVSKVRQQIVRCCEHAGNEVHDVGLIDCLCRWLPRWACRVRSTLVGRHSGTCAESPWELCVQTPQGLRQENFLDTMLGASV